jgi:hypothetical protein
MIRLVLLALLLTACADVDDVASESRARVTPPSCGIWIGADEAEADARSLSGAAPDAEVRTLGQSTCSDALAIAAQRWPGRSVVRYTVYRIDVRSAQAAP